MHKHYAFIKCNKYIYRNLNRDFIIINQKKINQYDFNCILSLFPNNALLIFWAEL